jgi:hypothetical protein
MTSWLLIATAGPLSDVICLLGLLATAGWIGWRFGPTLAPAVGRTTEGPRTGRRDVADGVAVRAREQEHLLDTVHRAAQRAGVAEITGHRLDGTRQSVGGLGLANHCPYWLLACDQRLEQSRADLAASTYDKDHRSPFRVVVTPDCSTGKGRT